MIVRLTRRRGEASFASYVHTMVSMANCAEFQGFAGFVDWRGGMAPRLYEDPTAPANMWEWFFEQPMGVPDSAVPDETWVYEEAAWRPSPELCGVGMDLRWELPWNAQTPEAIAALRRIVPKFLKIRDSVKDRAGRLFAAYGLDPAAAVAVSCRGTEKKLEAAVADPEDFFPWIDAELRRGDRTLWVKAEEWEAAQKFLRRYPDAVLMDEFYYGPSAVLSDRQDSRRGFEKAFDAVTMLCMFSQCGTLVKNASNLGDLAAGLSGGTVVCVEGGVSV